MKGYRVSTGTARARILPREGCEAISRRRGKMEKYARSATGLNISQLATRGKPRCAEPGGYSENAPSGARRRRFPCADFLSPCQPSLRRLFICPANRRKRRDAKAWSLNAGGGLPMGAGRTGAGSSARQIKSIFRYAPGPLDRRARSWRQKHSECAKSLRPPEMISSASQNAGNRVAQS